MTTDATPRIALPTRHVDIRPVRRPYSAPTVTKDELTLAVQMIAGMYEPLAPHADVLEEWAAQSRQNAYAIVQFGWTLAKVEAKIGDRRWFRNSWVPSMKEAQDSGEAMPENLPQGSPVRMGRSERDMVISAVGPMFCAGSDANDAIRKMVPRAIVGDRGSHLRAALKLIELVLGTEGYQQFEEQLKAARAEAASVPAPDAAEEESDNDSADAPAAEEVAQAS